jgi:hypothetical protein
VKADEEVLERVTGLTGAVIRVGDGRGFVVERARQRLVLTAAHCLPHLPPANPMSHTEERTYEALLGPLGAEPTVWAECLFADPVADIAILDGPDNQALFDARLSVLGASRCSSRKLPTCSWSVASGVVSIISSPSCRRRSQARCR